MNPFAIEIISESDGFLPTWQELLTNAAEVTLQQAEVAPPASLTVLLADDAHIQQLNRDYRQQDKPTDVLSFPAGKPAPGETEPYLGDIAIAIPTARRQAAASGHALSEELQLLVVHGVLHLLGHDHATPEEKAEMWAAQTAVLQALGLSHVSPTEN